MDEFFSKYLVYQLSLTKSTNFSQLYNVIKGKRTASMLFISFKNRWNNLFGIEPTMSRASFTHFINLLKKNLMVQVANQEIEITEKGKEYSHAFIQEFRRYETPLNIGFNRVIRAFWLKVNFIVQVVSEYLHHNSQYTPLESDLSQQLWVKRWLKKQGGLSAIVSSWVKESIKLVEVIPNEYDRKLLTFQLIGHQHTGLTNEQLCQRLQITPFQLKLDRLYAIQSVIKRLDSSTTPLIYSIYHEALEEESYGLSSTSMETYYYLKCGLNIEEIARKKRVKNSTVNEHILELAISMESFPRLKFIKKQNEQKLNNLFDENLMIRYKDAKNKVSELNFLEFRLLQVERIYNEFAK